MRANRQRLVEMVMRLPWLLTSYRWIASDDFICVERRAADHSHHALPFSLSVLSSDDITYAARAASATSDDHLLIRSLPHLVKE